MRYIQVVLQKDYITEGGETIKKGTLVHINDFMDCTGCYMLFMPHKLEKIHRDYIEVGDPTDRKTK